MRFATVAICSIIWFVGWLAYIVVYNRSTGPTTVEQRKTTAPWLVAFLSIFWPFLFVWTVLHLLFTLFGRIGRKEASP